MEREKLLAFLKEEKGSEVIKLAEGLSKELFHTLWGKAKTGEAYDREEWNVLQLALQQLGLKL